jgi:carboxymethylenebutenolidase
VTSRLRQDEHHPARVDRGPGHRKDVAMSFAEPEQLTAAQRAMVELWQRHMAAEFQRRDASESCGTMTPDATVNHVPVLTGGNGLRQLEHYYGSYFIPQMPDDVEMVPVARTIGEDRIVDEFVFRFTHSVRMDWFVPGVEPTGRRLEVATVVAIDFRDGKMAAERIYWDQASVLVQLGLLDPAGLPVVGAESARKVLDPSLPCNALMKRWVADDAL